MEFCCWFRDVTLVGVGVELSGTGDRAGHTGWRYSERGEAGWYFCSWHAGRHGGSGGAVLGGGFGGGMDGLLLGGCSYHTEA